MGVITKRIESLYSVSKDFAPIAKKNTFVVIKTSACYHIQKSVICSLNKRKFVLRIPEYHQIRSHSINDSYIRHVMTCLTDKIAI
jgi:hypothetical protein